MYSSLKKYLSIICVFVITLILITSVAYAEEGVTFSTSEEQLVIVDTIPTNNPENVQLNVILTLSFNKRIQFGENTSQIILMDALNNQVPITSFLTGNGMILGIKPTAALSYNTSYTLSVPKGTIVDETMGSLESDYSMNFKTIAADAPRVTGLYPNNGDTYVPLDIKEVYIKFGNVIDFNQSTIAPIIIDSVGNTINHYANTISYDTLILKFDQNLHSGSTYTVIIPGGYIKYKQSNIVLYGDLKYTFTTTGSSKLGILTTNPYNYEGNITTDKIISVNFNRRIVLPPTNSGVQISDRVGNIIPNTIALDATGSSLLIMPSSTLADGTAYKVTISSGSITSTDGYTLMKPYIWKFSTSYDPPLAPGGIVPMSDSNKIDINTAFNITFNYQMHYSGKGFVGLKDLAGNIVDSNWLISGNSFTVSPKTPLDYNKEYKLIIEQGSVLDNLENPLVRGYEYNYLTKEQNDLAIISAVPSDGAVEVVTEGAITIRFNKQITLSTGAAAITLKSSLNNLVEMSCCIIENGTAVQITPARNFKYNMLYTLSIPRSSINDTSLNGLLSDYTMSFRTIIDPATIFGDVDGDGIVTSRDLAFVQRFISKIIDEFPLLNGKVAADVDGDKKITGMDVTEIKKILLGQINKFSRE